MTKQAIITLRCSEDLKAQFEHAVRMEILEALQQGNDISHISSSEILRAFMKAYIGGFNK